jgi:hypothetical protein
MVDMDLQMDKARIMTYTRIMSNEEDTLTKRMMDWKQGRGGRTERQETQEAMNRLGMEYDTDDLVILGPQYTKIEVNTAMQEKQTKRWERTKEREKRRQTGVPDRKKEWGLDSGLRKLQAYKARRYIQVRLGDYQPEQVSEGNAACAHCMRSNTSLRHELWWCPGKGEKRKKWKDKMEGRYSGTWTRLKGMKKDEVTEFLLGRGQGTCEEETWNGVQELAVNWVWHMTGTWREPRNKSE